MWVSDDRTIVQREDGTGLVARPPATIAGRIADRKHGILSVPHAASAVLALVVDLDLRNDQPVLGASARLLNEVLPMLRLPPVTPENADQSAWHVLVALGGRQI
jgi:serine kinase of HPr protein (carbohydrate metabolism regulator)